MGKQGLTLIEIAVVLAIIASATIFIIPSISAWVQHYQLRQAARQMAEDLQFAKMRAISRGGYCTVVFSISINGTPYDYIVFEDTDEDLEYDNDTDNILSTMRFADEFSNVILESVDFPPNDNGHEAIAFNGYGMPMTNDNTPLDDEHNSVTIKNIRTEKSRQIFVSPIGRIRIQQ